MPALKDDHESSSVVPSEPGPQAQCMSALAPASASATSQPSSKAKSQDSDLSQLAALAMAAQANGHGNANQEPTVSDLKAALHSSQSRREKERTHLLGKIAESEKVNVDYQTQILILEMEAKDKQDRIDDLEAKLAVAEEMRAKIEKDHAEYWKNMKPFANGINEFNSKMKANLANWKSDKKAEASGSATHSPKSRGQAATSSVPKDDITVWNTTTNNMVAKVGNGAPQPGRRESTDSVSVVLEALKASQIPRKEQSHTPGQSDSPPKKEHGYSNHQGQMQAPPSTNQDAIPGAGMRSSLITTKRPLDAASIQDAPQKRKLENSHPSSAPQPSPKRVRSSSSITLITNKTSQGQGQTPYQQTPHSDRRSYSPNPGPFRSPGNTTTNPNPNPSIYRSSSPYRGQQGNPNLRSPSLRYSTVERDRDRTGPYNNNNMYNSHNPANNNIHHDTGVPKREYQSWRSFHNSKRKTVTCWHWKEGTCTRSDEDCDFAHWEI